MVLSRTQANVNTLQTQYNLLGDKYLGIQLDHLASSVQVRTMKEDFDDKMQPVNITAEVNF